MNAETFVGSLNKGDSQKFEREVASVTVSTGSLVVSYDTDNGPVTKTIKEGSDRYEVPNSPTVALFAPDHANYSVEFADRAIYAPHVIYSDTTGSDSSDPNPETQTVQAERDDTSPVDKDAAKAIKDETGEKAPKRSQAKTSAKAKK